MTRSISMRVLKLSLDRADMKKIRGAVREINQRPARRRKVMDARVKRLMRFYYLLSL